MLLYHPENIVCQNTGLFYARDYHYGRYLPVVYSEIHLQYFSQHSLFYMSAYTFTMVAIKQMLAVAFCCRIYVTLPKFYRLGNENTWL